MVLSKDLKFAICFGLIMGAIISICNMCFASEIEDIVPEVVNNRGLSSDGTISSSSTLNLYYVEIENNYKYYIYNDGSTAKNLGISNSIDAGTTVDELIVLQPHETYTYYGDSGYLFLCSSSSVVKFSRTNLEALGGFVDDIAIALSFSNLNQIVAIAVPIIAISVLFGLGFYLLKRLLNRIKRAKGGV